MALPPQRVPGKPSAPGKQAAQPTPAEDRHQSEVLGDETGKLEEELEALKARYEMYFLGVERREPARWREEVKKRVMRIKDAFTRNSGLKFRIQSLHARFISYERLWMRSAREKEAGTYRRDVLRARAHGKVREPEAAPPPAASAAPKPPAGAAPKAGAASAAAAAAPGVKPAAPGAKPSAPGAPVAATLAGRADDPARLRALYDAYISAKRSCNEDVSKLTYDAVARSVQKQVPELMARFKAKSVDFRVEVKDGKAILKAIPKV